MLPLNSHKYFFKNLFLIAETLEVLLVFLSPCHDVALTCWICKFRISLLLLWCEKQIKHHYYLRFHSY